MTSRERKIKFIKDHGRYRPYEMNDALAAAFREFGPNWLTDDQLQDMVEIQLRRSRRRQHLNMQNRKLTRASA